MLPKKEIWYGWKEYIKVFDESKKRFVTPLQDGQTEYPFDFIFSTEEAAIQGLKDFDIKYDTAKNWYLCEIVCIPIMKCRKKMTND
jgi:hypothetical protein